MEFELKLDQFNIPTSYTLILGIGIRYATLGEGGETSQVGYTSAKRVKYLGSAKLIGTMGVY
jgi:hypothetical protein